MRAHASAPVEIRPCRSIACIHFMASSRLTCGKRRAAKGSCKSTNSMRPRESIRRTRSALARHSVQEPSKRTVRSAIKRKYPNTLILRRTPAARSICGSRRQGQPGKQEDRKGRNQERGGGGEEIAERNAGHRREPNDVEQGDALQELSALSAENQVEQAKDQGREHEGDAESAEQIVHAAL